MGSPTANGGECGRYLEHGAYSAVGKREITCLWRDGSAWVGHVYGRRACTHGGCCATQSMGGWVVVTTSSSSYKLVVCVCGGTRKWSL